MNLAECEIRSVLFGLLGRVEEWNLTDIAVASVIKSVIELLLEEGIIT